MPEQKLTQKLEEWKTLLREGRVQEVDNQIEEYRRQAEIEEAEKKKALPPEAPPTDQELMLQILDEVTRLFGIPPDLQALMVELHGRVEKPKE